MINYAVVIIFLELYCIKFHAKIASFYLVLKHRQNSANANRFGNMSGRKAALFKSCGYSASVSPAPQLKYSPLPRRSVH